MILTTEVSLIISKNQEIYGMKPYYSLSLCIAFLLLTTLNAYAKADSAGIIKSVSGDVFITNSQTTAKAVVNMKIMPGDVIKTGKNGKAGLIFDDDTVVGLGPDSELSIKNFLFDPANKQLSFIAEIVHGTISFISGQITKLAPQKVKFETPDATLGVRGTKFLVKVD